VCGIAGRLWFDGRSNEGVGERFLDRLDNRGPDDSGVYSSGSAVLAHRRLSVIDPSAAGRQPMPNADESVWIVFNGEIYNYRELRDRVDHYSFRSDTDTEVLLHLYEEYGTDCLQYLRGMFAFGIWDERRQRLFLARDRFGQKPLFFWHSGEGTCFGSTIRAVLADESVTAAPDEHAIREFLNYQYVPTPRTGFENIQQVRPAEYVLVDEEGVRREQYWRLSFADKFQQSPGTLARRLRSHLETAVRLRLRSDVPLGVFLSGGVDSTVVTALAAQAAEDPVRTFSIGFERESHDELEYAEAVADRYGTDHRAFTVSPGTVDDLPAIVEHVEMPFGDPSILPTYHVSRIATDHTTVALTGDAGDENFAGYDRYGWDRLASTASHIPSPVTSAASGALAATPTLLSNARMARHARRFLDAASADEVGRYAEFICHADDEQVNRIWQGRPVHPEFATLRAAFDRADGPTRLDRLQQVDLETYLPDDLLTKADRASMAHAVEVRSPFLDHRLAEFAARVPAKYKYRRGEEKWLLKRACDDLLPDAVASRSKQGFGIPVHEWFRGPLRPMARERLERLGNRPEFDRRALLDTLDRHVERTADLGHHLWDLQMLDRWYERFIDP
jgi:asparagine synthase (glutamine-hydrolysing)